MEFIDIEYIKISLGQRIQRYRKNKNITQKELAEKIGKGVSTVQKYEIDVITPPIEVIKKIADVLEVEMADLVAEVHATNEEYDKAIIESDFWHIKMTELQNGAINGDTFFKEMRNAILNYQVKKRIELEQKNLQQLLDNYKTLNKNGQKEANRYIKYLLTLEEYTTPDLSEQEREQDADNNKEG